ncbi:hypothetical protein MMC20_007147 [Loxospora ochrophaea]|nr:hypothetical protein [Loxospora ochrophaea]
MQVRELFLALSAALVTVKASPIAQAAQTSVNAPESSFAAPTSVNAPESSVATQASVNAPESSFAAQPSVAVDVAPSAVASSDPDIEARQELNVTEPAIPSNNAIKVRQEFNVTERTPSPSWNSTFKARQLSPPAPPSDLAGPLESAAEGVTIEARQATTSDLADSWQTADWQSVDWETVAYETAAPSEIGTATVDPIEARQATTTAAYSTEPVATSELAATSPAYSTEPAATSEPATTSPAYSTSPAATPPLPATTPAASYSSAFGVSSFITSIV